MKAIVYTRPRIKTFFHELAKAIPCLDDVLFMSDHRGEEDIDIMSFYYVAKKEFLQNKALPTSNFDWNKIIRRCRYLRTLSDQKALLNAKAMCIAIERIVGKYQPDVILGMVMDSYILDLIDQVMRTRNSQYIGFLNNMINGYSRLTSRGELIKLHEPTPEMISAALKNLTAQNYIPNMQKDFMWRTSVYSMYFTKYLKEKAKILYYFIKKIKDRDPDNFYYNTVAAKSCMSCRRVDQLFFRRFEHKDWLDRIKKGRKARKLIIYLPLQFYPECSLDYWGTHISFSAFYTVIARLIANSYTKLIFLVKEHPSAMSLRKSSFYKNLISNKNIILVPFDVASNTVIPKVDLVLTWTGSVGVEAIMRGKPLATFGKAYYDPGYGILRLTEDSDLHNLEELLVEFHQQYRKHHVGQLAPSVVHNMISGLIPGYVFPLDYLTPKNPAKHEQMEILGKGINKFILRLKELGSYQINEGCI